MGAHHIHIKKWREELGRSAGSRQTRHIQNTTMILPAAATSILMNVEVMRLASIMMTEMDRASSVALTMKKKVFGRLNGCYVFIRGCNIMQPEIRFPTHLLNITRLSSLLYAI